MNDCVVIFNPLAKTCMQYTRCICENFYQNTKKVIAFIRKQKEKIIFKTIISIVIYSIIFLFRLKKFKTRKVNNLINAIKDIVIDMISL